MRSDNIAVRFGVGVWLLTIYIEFWAVEWSNPNLLSDNSKKGVLNEDPLCVD